jgi:flagellar protein FlaG
MQSKVARFAATPDPTYGRSSNSSAGSGNPGTGGEDAAALEEADLRLVIEEDQASGSYVYTTVNRRTGEVVQRLPREDVLRLREASAYQAGGVIRTKA